MPSTQDCAQRLREQAYRTILPLINGLEQELQNLSSSFSAGVQQIGWKLEALRNVELPTTEIVLAEILEDVARQKDLDTNSLALFARGLRQKETQEEILGFLLDGAQKFSPRIALFAVRGEQLVGWSSRGYSETAAGKIGSCVIPRSDFVQFQNAFEGEGLATIPDLSDEHGQLQFLQEEGRGPWHLLPLRAMQRPVALLVARGVEGTPCRSDELSILVDLTSLRIENIALKILYELTAPKPEAPPSPARAEEAKISAPVETPASSPELQPTIPPTPALAESLTAAGLEVELEGVEKAAPAEGVIAAAAAPEMAVAQPAPPEAVAPADAPKVQPQDALQVAEEEKLHAEAKRFARLLVSEIKLYNENQVAEGRKNHDLYLRLKRDIDRSRELFEKRVSPFVSRKIDYFHDEIVRILGDNDTSTLGSDYPGPRVES